MFLQLVRLQADQVQKKQIMIKLYYIKSAKKYEKKWKIEKAKKVMQKHKSFFKSNQS